MKAVFHFNFEEIYIICKTVLNSAQVSNRATATWPCSHVATWPHVMSIAEPVMVLKIKCTLFQLVSTNIYKIQNYLCQQMKNSIFHPWVWEDLTLPDLGGSFCPIHFIKKFRESIP